MIVSNIKMEKNQTLEYYNKNSEEFAEDTRSVEFTISFFGTLIYCG